MMGSAHSASGLFAGALLLPWAPVMPTPAAQASWVAVVGGMAMLPDLDHHSSTISRMWGAPSRLAGAGIGAVFGGHRNGTHSLLGVAVFTLVAWAAESWLGMWGRMFWIALAIGLALNAITPILPNRFRLPPGVPVVGGKTIHPENTVLGLNIVISWAGAWWLVHNTPPAATAWLPWAVALGMLTHMVGDWFTKGGVPWLWPIRWRNAAGLWTTGSTFEKAVATPAFVAGAVLMLDYHRLLGVNELVDGTSTLLGSLPWQPDVIDLAARSAAVALVAGAVAYVTAKDKRAWGAVT